MSAKVDGLPFTHLCDSNEGHTYPCVRTMLRAPSLLPHPFFLPDALVDADNNGVADIDEMDATKLFVHKLHIVFTSVNPEKLGSAVGNLNLAALAIIAALKVRFARIITLGRAMAEILSPVAKRILGPALAFCLPKDYQQWGAPSVGFLVQIAAIQVAWMLQRLLATVHSAMRGGMMFSRGGLAYLRKEGYIKKEDKDTYADEIVGATTASKCSRGRRGRRGTEKGKDIFHFYSLTFLETKACSGYPFL